MDHTPSIQEKRLVKKTIPVKKMILYGYSLSILLCITISVFSIVQFKTTIRATKKMSSKTVPFLLKAKDAARELPLLRHYEQDFFANIGRDDVQQSKLNDFNTALGQIHAKLDDLAKMLADDSYESVHDAAQNLTAAKEHFNQYARGFYDSVTTSRADAGSTPASANRLMEKHVQQSAAAEQKLSAVCDAITKLYASRSAELMEQSDRSYTIILAALLAGILLLTAMSYTLGSYIVGHLTRAMDCMKDTLGEVSRASMHIAALSTHIATGAHDQAASLQVTSSSLEVLSAMTGQNAGNARQANDIIRMATDAALKGESTIKDMVASVEHIKTSAGETSKILKTIEEIAFQTNILALNAAIEAARAGEAGLGFAAVAKEVRSLANRSAEAAQITAGLIEQSQTNADQNMLLSGIVTKLFCTISDQIKNVNELSYEVAAGSNEQARGIDQINLALAEVTRVTQDNAANTEESSASCQELASQAIALENIVTDMMALIGSNAQAGIQAIPAESPSTAVLQPIKARL